MIWYLLQTDALCDRMDAAYAAVSPARQLRADAHRHAEGRRAQLAAGLLERLALGTAADARTENAYGKPLLPDGRCYSVSHTVGAVALCVDTASVGIDVERARACDERVVRRFFLPEEQAYIRDSADRDAAFTALFTRKEAVVKAVGKGFALPLTAFCVLPMADTRVAAGGLEVYLHTERAGELFVSLASVTPGEWHCRRVLPEEILPQ